MLAEIKIEDYEPKFHVKHLFHWFSLRQMNHKLLDELPAVGSIALYKDLGVAAAFIRKIEPHYAMLDGLITNPEALATLRSDAIDKCVESVILKAKKMKIKQLMANTINAGVLKRSEKFGFLKLPHTSIVLNLEESWVS